MTKMEQGRVHGRVWREEREGEIIQLYYNLFLGLWTRGMTLGMGVLRCDGTFKRQGFTRDRTTRRLCAIHNDLRVCWGLITWKPRDKWTLYSLYHNNLWLFHVSSSQFHKQVLLFVHIAHTFENRSSPYHGRGVCRDSMGTPPAKPARLSGGEP